VYPGRPISSDVGYLRHFGADTFCPRRKEDGRGVRRAEGQAARL